MVTVRGGSTRVGISGGVSQRVTLDRRTTAEIADHRTQALVKVSNAPVDVVRRDTTVKTGGGMGVQGPKGEPGGTIPAMHFSFGDAAHAVWTPDSPGLLTYVRLIIDTPFDGVDAAIVVGTAAQPDAAMPAGYSDPAAMQEFENTPDIHLGAGEGVHLSITPGSGATQGAGRLILQYLPD